MGTALFVSSCSFFFRWIVRYQFRAILRSPSCGERRLVGRVHASRPKPSEAPGKAQSTAMPRKTQALTPLPLSAVSTPTIMLELVLGWYSCAGSAQLITRIPRAYTPCVLANHALGFPSPHKTRHFNSLCIAYQVPRKHTVLTTVTTPPPLFSRIERRPFFALLRVRRGRTVSTRRKAWSSWQASWD